jgi:hypothetical protein
LDAFHFIPYALDIIIVYAIFHSKQKPAAKFSSGYKQFLESKQNKSAGLFLYPMQPKQYVHP